MTGLFENVLTFNSRWSESQEIQENKVGRVLWDTLYISRPGPIVLNKKATGYYRVNYDEENWMLLADTLKNDHQAIHPLNRAQIICDVISLAKTGHVSNMIKDQIMEYIDKETDSAPLNAVKECSQDKEFNIMKKI